MWFIDTFLLLAILVFASAILVAIKKGFNEVIAALQSIHDQQSKTTEE